MMNRYNVGRTVNITWSRPVDRTGYNNNNILYSICYYKVQDKGVSGYQINSNIKINITGGGNDNSKGEVNGVNLW